MAVESEMHKIGYLGSMNFCVLIYAKRGVLKEGGVFFRHYSINSNLCLITRVYGLLGYSFQSCQ